jgi:hypothetical protein
MIDAKHNTKIEIRVVLEIDMVSSYGESDVIIDPISKRGVSDSSI